MLYYEMTRGVHHGHGRGRRVERRVSRTCGERVKKRKTCDEHLSRSMRA